MSINRLVLILGWETPNEEDTVRASKPSKPRQTHPGDATGTTPLCPICGFVCACSCHWDEEDRYQEAWDVQFRMEGQLREKDEEIEGLQAGLAQLAEILAPALEILIMGPRRSDTWETIAEAVGRAADLLGAPD